MSAKATPKAQKQYPPEIQNLIHTLQARYSLIHVPSPEEARVVHTFYSLRSAIDRSVNRKVFWWRVTRGLVEYNGDNPNEYKVDQATRDPNAALNRVVAENEKSGSIFIFSDLHPFLQAEPGVVRLVRDVAQVFRGTLNTLVLLSPRQVIPPDLEKEMAVVDFPLPTKRELAVRVELGVEDMKASPHASRYQDEYTPELRDQVVRAAQGLTMVEVDDVLARGVVECCGMTREIVDVINREKSRLVRKSKVLEIIDASEGMDSVGGLSRLKDWVNRRSDAFTDEALAFGLRYPKGVLTLGLPGGGKGLAARAVANEWKLPLVRLDFGSVFGGIVGESEGNLRSALQVVETMSPCVLWVDEVEKALSGVASSNVSDGGTTARVFGTFLTWLQEKKSPVFVYFTANDISNLPAELLRKGRIDELFFIDLPSHEERKEILAIHIRKRGRDPDKLGIDLDTLATESRGFVGAELETVVDSALVDAFYHRKQTGQGDLSTGFLLRAIQATVPLLRTMSHKIVELRNFVTDGRALPASGEMNDEVDDLLEEWRKKGVLKELPHVA